MLPLAAKVTVRWSNTARPAAWAMRHEAGVVKRRRACCRYQVQAATVPFRRSRTIRLAIANASSHSSRVQSVGSILETGAVAPKLRAAVDMSCNLTLVVRSTGVFPAPLVDRFRLPPGERWYRGKTPTLFPNSRALAG